MPPVLSDRLRIRRARVPVSMSVVEIHRAHETCVAVLGFIATCPLRGAVRTQKLRTSRICPDLADLSPQPSSGPKAASTRVRPRSFTRCQHPLMGGGELREEVEALTAHR